MDFLSSWDSWYQDLGFIRQGTVVLVLRSLRQEDCHRFGAYYSYIATCLGQRWRRRKGETKRKIDSYMGKINDQQILVELNPNKLILCFNSWGFFSLLFAFVLFCLLTNGLCHQSQWTKVSKYISFAFKIHKNIDLCLKRGNGSAYWGESNFCDFFYLEISHFPIAKYNASKIVTAVLS